MVVIEENELDELRSNFWKIVELTEVTGLKKGQSLNLEPDLRCSGNRLGSGWLLFLLKILNGSIQAFTSTTKSWVKDIY